MVEKTSNEKKLTSPTVTVQSSFSSGNDTFTSLSTTALLAKNAVPYAHRRIADNYVIIKRIYKFQAVQSRISKQEVALLNKYSFSPLEYSTIKQINEELAYLKKWAVASNELLCKDADDIMQIRSKELKFMVSGRYSALSNEVCDGYEALERYFEEITKFYR